MCIHTQRERERVICGLAPPQNSGWDLCKYICIYIYTYRYRYRYRYIEIEIESTNGSTRGAPLTPGSTTTVTLIAAVATSAAASSVGGTIVGWTSLGKKNLSRKMPKQCQGAAIRESVSNNRIVAVFIQSRLGLRHRVWAAPALAAPPWTAYRVKTHTVQPSLTLHDTHSRTLNMKS